MEHIKIQFAWGNRYVTVSIKWNKKMYLYSRILSPSISMLGIWEMLGHWESAASILISGQPLIVKYRSDVRPRTACRRLNFLQLYYIRNQVMWGTAVHVDSLTSCNHIIYILICTLQSQQLMENTCILGAEHAAKSRYSLNWKYAEMSEKHGVHIIFN